MSDELRNAIIATSQSLGISPVDLATAMSYETGGTFDPWQKGPTTKWGEHRGLIQWGEPQRQKYGVTRETPVRDQVAAAGRYLKDTGVQPGMGLMDVYSAINAGGVGRYNRSDTAAGGAPGTVADKVNNQMSGHRIKAQALLGGDFAAPQPAPVMGSMSAGMRPPQAPPPQMAPQGAPPAAARSLASSEGTSSKLSNIFGMLSALQPQQQQAAPPPQIQGPSPEQAQGLAQLIQALQSRVI